MNRLRLQRECLLLRADASTEMGVGHLMRCLALAQAWQECGGRTVFLVRAGSETLSERLRAEGADVHRLRVSAGSLEDAEQLIELASSVSAACIAVDGYQFAADYQRRIKESGLRLMVVDDVGHADFYHADVVLNQNLGANERLYERREPHTRLLLGPRYTLLRREFWEWRSWSREVAERVETVLITFGGSDPTNASGEALRVLESLDATDMEVLVIVGATNPNWAELHAAASSSRLRVRIENDTRRMPELMARADVAVCPGGTTFWELAFMGVPTVLVPLVDNHWLVARALESAGLVVNAGRCGAVSPAGVRQALATVLESASVRADLSRRGREVVDGRGGERVVEELRR